MVFGHLPLLRGQRLIEFHIIPSFCVDYSLFLKQPGNRRE